MSTRDKFLTEAMGECWHEAGEPQGDSIHIPITLHCKHCGELMCMEGSCRNHAQNSNFSTWDGFGRLWTWAQEQEWWESLYYGLGYTLSAIEHFIHPDRFADAVYKFLKYKFLKERE